MKKLLLSVTALFAGYAAYAQVVCAGVSPASIQGNYDFGLQANCGLWPGETDDGTWGVWSGGLDFNIAGDYVMDTLMLVEDGTPGTNAQGNPISEEGCNTLTNNLTGKIAVIFRNTCEFGAKVYNAQQAGAVAAIIINREPGIINMLGGTQGLNVTIPAVALDFSDGMALVNEMSNGPVVMFIGNKIGAFANDVGAVKGEFMVSPFGGANSYIYDGFDPGIQVYNYGTGAANVTVTANIDGPGGSSVYSSTVGPISMNSGDTVSIFAGNTDQFTTFALGVGNYPAGTYTLSYTIDGGFIDDANYDNYYEAQFMVNTDVISLARLDASNMPVHNSYPWSSSVTTEYQSCMFMEEASYGGRTAYGAYFVGHSDTTFAGTEIFVNAYQWQDTWVDINDASFDWTPSTTNAYNNLTLVTFADFIASSDAQIDQVVYGDFQTPIMLQDGARYLFCLQTFEPTTISFGYDNAIDYGANYSILAMPVSPVFIDGSWYTAGWNGVSAPSIAINTAPGGLESTEMIKGSAFPNPAINDVVIEIEGEGSATLQVTDIAGRVAMTDAITLSNGKAGVNIASLESGIYVFNVTLENGQSSTFNVIKK